MDNKTDSWLKEATTEELVKFKNFLEDEINDFSSADAWLIACGTGSNAWRENRVQTLCCQLDEVEKELDDRSREYYQL